MIISNPALFDLIVAFFIAFTAAWLTYVLAGKRAIQLKIKIDQLEAEKAELCRHVQQLEEQFQNRYAYPFNSTPVISLSSGMKLAGKASDAASV